MAETVILSDEPAANDASDDHSAGYTDNQLRALIDEGEASGPALDWDGAAVKAEVLRRHALRGRASPSQSR